MRISELAEVAGVTTRAIRHYHHLGLLPEPERLANGYRDYGLRHAVLLARIRRLTELGLGLSEVRDVLADEAGADLTEVLQGLDATLALQQEVLASQRERVGALLREARAGRLTSQGPVSPELGTLFAALRGAWERQDMAEPASAVKDREVLALLETTASQEDREGLLAAMRELSGSEGVAEDAYEVYALLDELAAPATADDPRVERAARALTALLSGTALGSLAAGAAGGPPPESGLLDAVFADLDPAQAAAVRRSMLLLQEGPR